MHHFLVAAAKNKRGVFKLLHRAAQQGFGIVFRVFEYLLKFVDGEHDFYVLFIQKVKNLTYGIFLLGFCVKCER